MYKPSKKELLSRGLTVENAQLRILNHELGISTLFIGDWGFVPYSSYSDSEIPNPQLVILSPTGELIYQLGDIIPTCGYYTHLRILYPIEDIFS